MDEYTDLTNEALQSLRSEKKDAFDALVALESPTTQQVAEAKGLAKEIDDIDAEAANRAETAKNDAADFEALKSKTFAGDEAPEADAGEEDEGTDEPEAEEASEDEPEEAAEEPEEAARKARPRAPKNRPGQGPAGGRPRMASVKTVAAKVERPDVPDTGAGVTLVAASNVPGFGVGQEMSGMEDVNKAIVNVMKGFPGPTGHGGPPDLRKFGVASFQIPFDEDLQINDGTADHVAVVERAAQMRAGDDENLVAAGWCAPSETIYDLVADESLDGILDLPEMQVNRGGIRYTMGPQFADFYAEAGFIQTEAQAEADTPKPCYEVDCPSFTEVRLDAVGLCLKVPILTNAAYPELVQRFSSGSMIAHQHMVNANVIGRIVTSAGAARVFTGLGATATDAFEALEQVAEQRRQTYRLSFNRAVEVVLPHWYRGVLRSDMSRRTGISATDPINDAVIDAEFAARNLNVQFVYDWQDLDVTAEVYPATVNALVYPAGTFVKGVSDVINLSAVYDAASLEVNMYTGLFVEQGLLVARRQYAADLVTLPIESQGRTGRTDLGAANA